MDNGYPSVKRPKWWEDNQTYKRMLDLPDYEPPRFRDGTYVHEVVDPLEERFECDIHFATDSVGYPLDWEVRVDGVPVMTVKRHRDADGNTVYEIESDRFRDQLVARLSF